MRYWIALAISLVLIVGMFAYSHWMMGYVKQRSDQNMTLPRITTIGIQVGYTIANYWHLFVPLLVAIPLAVAKWWPKSN
jgi:hypothetical protein